MLGYEVFNPPYISPIKDQSANLDWDRDQQTTLPASVFAKLSNYDFFYNWIDPQISELLNQHFDAVIVTISPNWLTAFAKVYEGKLIYRVYGQIDTLSRHLFKVGMLGALDKRDDFWFVPHAAEALQGEHAWLRERMDVVPYSLPEDIFAHQDTWIGGEREIALSCPNVDNHFYRAHFGFLKANFPDPHFRYFGKQLAKSNDPNIVGTLERADFLERFRRASGYLYTYTDARVCYLPPLEMMVLGGPVLFLRGSLLDRFMPADAPGRCESIEHAKALARRLLDGDKPLISSIVGSQTDLRRRYSPDYVWPIFDATFRRILAETNAAPRWLIETALPPSDARRVYVLHHFPGHPVVFDGRGYAAYDGIPRVVRLVVQALSATPDVEVVVTAYAHQVETISAFFRGERFAKNVRVLCVDPQHLPKLPAGGAKGSRRLSIWRLARRSAKFSRKMARRSFRALVPESIRGALRSSTRRYTRYAAALRGAETGSNQVAQYIRLINSDPACVAVLVPHYYWFPEALGLSQRMLMYLPDYMPHFFHGTGEFKDDERHHTDIGRMLVSMSDSVFCNSRFTRSYLPSSRLNVPDSKIRVFYLPMLNAGDQNAAQLAGDPSLEGLPDSYLFYPTQARANKNLALLIRVFDRLADERPGLGLCLTSRLDPDPKALAAYRRMRHRDRVVFREKISDEQLHGLYRRATMLCFTSMAEGNFPPQIQESLAYRLPVVAGRHLFITERFPADGPEPLVLCEPNNEDAFVSACAFVLDNREAVLERQQALLDEFDDRALRERFHNEIVSFFGVGTKQPPYEG
jgi:glycosyltransferase involved in cell wall biosynthesis